MTDQAHAALLPPERRAQITELVRRNKSVLVKDLCAQFRVTGETIRKDLAILEQEGALIKTYGGAYVQDGVRNEVDASIRASLFPEVKDAIGIACARLVEDGDTLFLDESTTCLAIARHLLEREGITVVTNSLPLASLFAEKGRGKLVLSGGELDRKNQCFVGGAAEDALGAYYVDKSFVSCRGADQTVGITDGNAINGRIRALMLRRARKHFLVLDHTKLGKSNFSHICDFSAVDAVVTDALPDPSWEDFFRSQGLRMILTPPRR